MSAYVEALDLVDRGRYPIDQPESAAYAALVAQCQEQLAATGASILPDFLVPAAIDRALESAKDLVAHAFHSEITNGSPYLELPDDSWPDGHPRLMNGPTSLSATPYDRFPAVDPIRRLYESDTVMEFLAAALGRPCLYRYDDPLGALNLAVMEAGDQLWWHFDQTDFVVSIALQASHGGGDFECVSMIRNEADECYDAVGRILTGSDAAAVRVPMEPGTLMLFQGRYSIHRVTPVEGDLPRLVALLAYDTKPGTCSSELSRAFPVRPDRVGAVEFAATTQIGEGFVGDGAEAAHVNTVLGRYGGPVETAWATALATPRIGHAPFVAVLRPNLPVKPLTLFVNKADIRGDEHGTLVWGAAQAGVAGGVADAVGDAVIPADAVDALLLIAAVWVSWSAVDADAVYRNNREATRTALANGAAGRPSVAEMLVARDAPENPYFRPTPDS